MTYRYHVIGKTQSFICLTEIFSEYNYTISVDYSNYGYYFYKIETEIEIDNEHLLYLKLKYPESVIIPYLYNCRFKDILIQCNLL